MQSDTQTSGDTKPVSEEDPRTTAADDTGDSGAVDDNFSGSDVAGDPTWDAYDVAGCTYDYARFDEVSGTEPYYTVRYIYDDAARIVNAEIAWREDLRYTLEYSYDAAGCRVSDHLIYDDSGASFDIDATVTRTCDDQQRPLTENGEEWYGPFEATYTYTDVDGVLAVATESYHDLNTDQTTEYAWSYTWVADQIVAIAGTADGAAFRDYSYTYDGPLLVREEMVAWDPDEVGYVDTTVYDEWSRVTESSMVQSDGVSSTYSYTNLAATDHPATTDSTFADANFEELTSMQYACTAGFPYACEGAGEEILNDAPTQVRETESWSCE